VRVPLVYKNAPQFGFDIGAHTVKVLQLHARGHATSVVGYGSCYFPPEAMAEGIVVDPKQMAAAIKPLLEKPHFGKLTSKRAVAGLPAAKLFTRTLQLPPMNETDLAQAIHYEVEQYVPAPIADLYIDHEVIRPRSAPDPKNPEAQMEVVMMAAPRAIVDSYIKLFDALNLELGAVEANMTATIRGLTHSGDASGSTLVLDIGSAFSDLTIYDQFAPLSGSVASGGQNLTDSLVQQLGIKPDQAAEIKEKFGLTKSGMQAKVVAAWEPQLSAVVREVKRVVKFYQSRNGDDQKVGAMVLSGGTARTPGLDTYFQHETGLPVSIANPWKNLTIHHPPTSHDAEAPKYTTAVGLALRGVSHD
jgi:type IV pilus assembly protein PilM